MDEKIREEQVEKEINVRNKDEDKTESERGGKQGMMHDT